MQEDRVRMFGVSIDRLNLQQATERVLGWARADAAGPCRYVVTPNVDHAVMLQHDTRLRAAYERAAMVVADGAPLVAVSRWLGKALPERVAGSDLVPAVLAAGADGLRVFLLGAGPGVADRAAANIRARWPGINTVGTHCPPLGFQDNDGENDRILELVAAARPDLLIIGLGAPKQELWAHRFHTRLGAKVALCAGATIDFLAGEKHRAPRWAQRTGLEWAHRLASEPRRLAGRYARDAWEFPRLVWNEYRGAIG